MKHIIFHNDRAGIGLSRTYDSLYVDHPDIETLTAIERDCRNYLNAERRMNIYKGNARAMMECL